MKGIETEKKATVYQHAPVLSRINIVVVVLFMFIHTILDENAVFKKRLLPLTLFIGVFVDQIMESE